jgi:hypothetical protein
MPFKESHGGTHHKELKTLFTQFYLKGNRYTYHYVVSDYARRILAWTRRFCPYFYKR